MGLDIYFYKVKTEDGQNALNEMQELQELMDNETNEEKYNELQEQLADINPFKDEIAYFRKVNLLLSFFNYEENCSFKEIDKTDIETLIENCNEVLKDNSKAELLLPTNGGFFFGNTDYNDFYFENIKEVRKTFKKIINKLNEDESIYMFCWW